MPCCYEFCLIVKFKISLFFQPSHCLQLSAKAWNIVCAVVYEHCQFIFIAVKKLKALKSWACPRSSVCGCMWEKWVGVFWQEAFWSGASQLLVGVPAWGSLLLADWASPAQVCDSALAKFHRPVNSFCCSAYLRINVNISLKLAVSLLPLPSSEWRKGWGFSYHLASQLDT